MAVVILEDTKNKTAWPGSVAMKQHNAESISFCGLSLNSHLKDHIQYMESISHFAL
jgi:hypothetical protein